MVALLGPSGSGKTTLLRICRAGESVQRAIHVSRYRRPSRVHACDRKVGFVFSAHYALFRHMTVFDNIAFGLTVLPSVNGQMPPGSKGKLPNCWKFIQLAHLADRYPAQLSGGQKQRGRVTRALASENCKILLLDEPFGALDAGYVKN